MEASAKFGLLRRGGMEPAFSELARLFEVDPKQPQDVQLSAKERREGVRIFEFSFASPVPGRVPGVLLTPDRPGWFPTILFGHWMMEGSPMRNHTEFLEEARVYARAGAICMLLDTPLVRAGVTEDPDMMHGQEPKAALQMAREWRRAIDILVVRKDVDPRRIAYVGHSFSAGVGAKLTAVEKRIQSFVLMANTYSLREFVYDEHNPQMVAFRQKRGEQDIQTYLQQFPWDDSRFFVSHSAPAGVFIQNGRLDAEIPERIVRKSFEYFQEPKRIEFYDAGHELNSAARMDRANWLQDRLQLGTLDMQALGAIPQLH
jgi:cephalosporin-C deacetylase-like acetyl esterase